MSMRSICLVLMLASPAAAATVTPATTPDLRIDALGFQCVDGGGYDDVFPAGKGVRAPQFCIEDPCARVLSYDEFADEIVGAAPDPAQWRRYQLEMTAQCGTPTAALTDEQLLAALFNGTKATPGFQTLPARFAARAAGALQSAVRSATPERPGPATGPAAPGAGRFQFARPAADAAPVAPAAGPSGKAGPAAVVLPGDGQPLAQVKPGKPLFPGLSNPTAGDPAPLPRFTDTTVPLPGGGPVGSPDNIVAPVPLPAPVLMLMTALGGLAALRRRVRRKGR